MPRNSSGVYTLPAGNPVTTRTIIESSWANNTMSDIANEITESLARNGAGGMTGPMKAIDGTAAAPSITFGSETSTGLYRVTSGQLGISTGGVQRFNISSSGSTFSVPVTVNGNLTVSGTISGNGSSITSINASNISSGTLADARLSSNVPLKNVSNTFTANQQINASGGVGLTINGVANYYTVDFIGQPDGSNNAYAFRAKGNATGAVYATVENTSAAGSANLWVAANNFSTRLKLTCDPTFVSVGSETSQPLYLRTADTNRITISTGGNVTINAPVSGSGLTVNGVSGAYAVDFTSQPDGSNNAYPFRAQGNATGGVYATVVNTSATGFANISVASNNFGSSMRLMSAPTFGAVGTSTSHPLALRTNDADRVTISSGGNVTINAPTSGTTLYVNGDIYATGTITQGSDERLKTEIRTIDGALAKVCAMRGVSFTRKDTGKREVGVIAHEVAEVVPEVVSEVENGHLSVAYGNMVGVLIEAVKELREEVWQLKAQYCH
jgi:uncharacterized protein YaiE (UPF0345 family)